MKLQKLDDLLLNLVVVFEARRIKGMNPLRTAEAVYPRKVRENTRSHTDSISPSLATERAMLRPLSLWLARASGNWDEPERAPHLWKICLFIFIWYVRIPYNYAFCPICV